jgi:putative aldouronate transport system substrate-binding protein
VFTPTQSGFRDALRYVAELVREGVFDPNSFTQTGDQLKRRVMNKPGSLVGMTIGNQPPVFIDVDFSDPHARWQDYKNLPPVAGPSGRAYVAWDYSPPGGAGLVISKSCKDPKTMVRWADAMLGLIPTLNQQTGPQGKFWGWAKPGAKGIDGRSAVYQLMPNEAKNAGWNQWGPFAYSLDVRNANAVTGATMEPLIYAAGKASEPFASPKNEYFLAPYFDANQAAQIGEITTNLQNHYTQATTRFCLGQDDIESDAAWNSYVSKYDQLGLAQYLKINTEAMKANK